MDKKDISIAEEILEILENNSKYTVEQIAVMVNRSVEEVKDIISKFMSGSTTQ